MFVTFSITTYIIVFILTFYDVRILDQTVPLQWISYFCRLLWNSSSTCFNCWFTIWSYSHWANVNHGRFIASWNTITNSKIYLNYSLIWWQNFKNVQEIKIFYDFLWTDQIKAKKMLAGTKKSMYNSILHIFAVLTSNRQEKHCQTRLFWYSMTP